MEETVCMLLPRGSLQISPHLWRSSSIAQDSTRLGHSLARAITKLLAKHQHLQGIVARQHTSTGNCTQHVGACTLEHRLDALILQDLGRTVHRRAVLDRRARRHHHATTDGVDGV
eukprot:357218-Chlamydomonas_euryale.AAC.10